MIKLNKVLFPTDFSRCANQALPHAIKLAKQYNAEFHMLHAVVLHEDDPHNPAYHFPDKEEINKRLKDITAAEMNAVLKDFDTESLETKQEQRWGISAAPVILEYAVDNKIELIVMGTHGRRGLGHFFLGSVAEEVVRLSPCPVLTVREREEEADIESIEHILIPTDFSVHSQKALTYAKEIAKLYGSKLQLLHVIEETVHPAFYVTGKTSIFELVPDIKTKSIQAMEKQLDETEGSEIGASIDVVEGRAATEIIKFAETHRSDLIVIATHGLTGIEHMLIGSIAEKVVRQAQCPVFTVKVFGISLV
jgi:nucleotide-binding universal stress UspA family protein